MSQATHLSGTVEEGSSQMAQNYSAESLFKNTVGAYHRVRAKGLSRKQLMLCHKNINCIVSGIYK